MANHGASRTYADYTVAWICAIHCEQVAARAALDEVHPKLPSLDRDTNNYSFGKIGEHNVVIASLPSGSPGTDAAARTANQMSRTFPDLRLRLMVGIGGGVPKVDDDPRSAVDVRLGDVAVSDPKGTATGVVQYNSVKIIQGLHWPTRNSTSNKPPEELRSAVGKLKLKSDFDPTALSLQLNDLLRRIRTANPSLAQTYAYPGADNDILFKAKYIHESGKHSCEHCSRTEVEKRSPRPNTNPVVHYGTIASGNQLMRDSITRDHWRDAESVICFEMEAAGLMDHFPCLVVRGICDYSDSHKNDAWQGYAAVVAAAYAKELLLEISPVMSSNLGQTSTNRAQEIRDYKIPFSLEGVPVVGKFVQRADEMTKIASGLVPGKENTPRRKIFVLHGAGGSGKTQLAVEFSRNNQRSFTSVFWLDGSTENRLRQSFVSAWARICQTETGGPATGPTGTEDVGVSVRKFLAWLREPENSKWFLVFDNVDRDHTTQPPDPEAYDIDRYLPVSDNGSILITTRLSRLQHKGDSQRVTRMNTSQGKAILEARLGKSIQGLDEIVEELGGLPLALAQAGSTMNQTHSSAEEYLHMYRQTWTQLLNEGTFASIDDYPQRTLISTWEMSYQQVERSNPAAAQMLQLFSCLDHSDIWYELFLRFLENEARPNIEIPLWLDNLRNAINYKRAIATLEDFSMVEPKESSAAISVHPVIHEWCYRRIADQSSMLQIAIHVVGSAVPAEERGGNKKSNAGHVNDWRLAYRLLPHSNRVSKLFKVGQNVGSGSKTEASLLYYPLGCLGTLCSRLGRPHEAEELYKRALNVREHTNSCNDEDTSYIFNSLGIVYKEQGRLSEAEKMFQRALDLREEVLGPEHLSTLEAVNNIAILYRRQNKLKEAEEMFRRAIDGRIKILGPDHQSTLDIVNNLGVLYWDQGKLEEAEGMYQRAIDGYIEVLGPNHPSTLDIVNNLGLLYSDQGKLKEAEEMYRRAIDGRLRVLGPEHPLTLTTVNNLGILYWDQGKLKEAEEMYRRAIDGYTEVLGPEHPSTLETVYNLGILYSGQGKLKESEEMYRRALKGKENALGRNHASTLRVIGNIGVLYGWQGRSEEAEKMFQEAWEGFEAIYGSDHPTTTLARENLLDIQSKLQGSDRTDGTGPKEDPSDVQRELPGSDRTTRKRKRNHMRL